MSTRICGPIQRTRPGSFSAGTRAGGLIPRHFNEKSTVTGPWTVKELTSKMLGKVEEGLPGKLILRQSFECYQADR